MSDLGGNLGWKNNYKKQQGGTYSVGQGLGWSRLNPDGGLGLGRSRAEPRRQPGAGTEQGWTQMAARG